jgi:hypothetical protein
MQSVADPKRLTTVLLGAALLGAALLVGGCTADRMDQMPGISAINAQPTSYKADILAAMHAYLSDPTGIRDAGISEPTLRSATMSTPARYIGCVRYNAKKTATVYAGMHEVAAIFLAGRFDQFVDPPKELCAGVTYEPFPELGTLTR